MFENNRTVDFVIAVLLVAIGSILSSQLASGLPWIGIDDAAITRSYAENIANGAGYVYNVGGERVEGSTALLWVIILTVAYWITPTPEVIIIALGAIFALLSVFLTLRLTDRLCAWLNLERGPAIIMMTILLLASPGYFMWTVWSMMELALWSMVLISLVYLLCRATEGEGSVQQGWIIIGLAALMPMIRPEGIAVSVGLLGLACILSFANWRFLVGAIAASVAVFIAITTFRLSYFGQAFPNTFYAKVSSDRVQDLKDGAKYLIDFINGRPFAEILVIVWLSAAIWAVINLRNRLPGAKAMTIIAAAVFGMLSIYAVLGGDHFALWRFYQPAVPLLPIAIALLFAFGFRALMAPKVAGATALGVGVFGVGVIVIGMMHYYQSRFFVVREYTLVSRGVDFGEYLNTVTPNPSIGTGPAGGIALAYDGEILDLLGLNWTVMAHANPIKVGMRNHASFDKDTFWEHSPDVLTIFNRFCDEGGGLRLWAANDDAFDNLFSDTRFREAYAPVAFRDAEECWPGFAKPEWLAQVDPSKLTQFDWADVIFEQ